MLVDRLQIVVDAGRPAPLCAGLPPAVRGAHRAARELPEAKVLVPCKAADARRWSRQLAQARADVAGHLGPDAPVLAVASDGFAEEGALARFVAQARSGGGAALAKADGRTVAAYLPAAGELANRAPAEAAARALESEGRALAFAGWTAVRTAEQAGAAERALCASLSKDTDGYIAKLDRRVSIAFSRALLRLPVTPNGITTASLFLGLAGAAALAAGAGPWQLAGALTLWFCCILDGCDGEVARLKLLCSESGAAYDVAADHVAHLATFVAVPLAVHRARPELAFWGPGLLLVSGFLGAMASVWWLVLRLPDSERGPFALLIERVASRDYVYLILALVLAGRLEWFLWAAGVGSHLFYLGLWWVSAFPSPSARRPLPQATTPS